jgi:hypothetical protein
MRRCAKKHAVRNGFVSGVLRLQPGLRGKPESVPAKAPASEGGRYKCPEKTGADRPAGTREALPGTKIEKRNSKNETE